MHTESATAIDWNRVSRDFLLAPDEAYLNGGTFSALPRPVFEAQTRLMAEAEANPTHHTAAWRELPFRKAQAAVARYVGADPDDLVLQFNVTHALNLALFGLAWPVHGEILVSDQEYGAIVNATRELARRRGLTVRVFHLPWQVSSPDELVRAVLDAVSPATVGLLVSHVTSPSGTLVPVERLSAPLRERGVRLVVDGAHAPGLVPLALAESGVDLYGANLHKWFMGPKSTGFLYVRRPVQAGMQSLTVGWGGADPDPARFTANHESTSSFYHMFRIQGVYDVCPFLALPATLAFRATLGEENIRGRIDALQAYLRRRLSGELGLRVLSPVPALSPGMTRFGLPAGHRGAQTAGVLHRRYKITVVGGEFEGSGVLRVSTGIWNTEAQIDRLADALREIFATGSSADAPVSP